MSCAALDCCRCCMAVAPVRRCASVALLYLETNYLVGAATGRLPSAGNLLGLMRSVELAIPDVCFMEALSAVMKELSRAREFQQQLQKRIGEIKESELMLEARQLRGHLEAAIIASGDAV